MANNNNRWPSPSQAYTGSNHGEQPQPELSVNRRNGDGRGNDSGASDHMKSESTLFSSYSPCAGFELGEDDWQC
ncbi:hypothetical protein KIW84_062623 [Lathyrus oleraceus]|uniref:Uncharacterized protein n=1 Tax=Pisum sativum TaxID=3888 RepID=A0A9D4W5N6_PEA|nr:hypothetical protein KIW84_062623 [Pisum sativum]